MTSLRAHKNDMELKCSFERKFVFINIMVTNAKENTYSTNKWWKYLLSGCHTKKNIQNILRNFSFTETFVKTERNRVHTTPIKLSLHFFWWIKTALFIKLVLWKLFKNSQGTYCYKLQKCLFFSYSISCNSFWCFLVSTVYTVDDWCY